MSPGTPLALLIALPAIALPAIALPAAAQSAPPNVIVILADDLGWGDVGPYDHDGDPTTPLVTNTPNLDLMAAQGARLTQFYVVAPVCTPSRAALQTGRYATRVGLTGVIFPNDPHGLARSEITIAELCRGQGYATGIIGKWHLGDQPQYHPLNQGYDTFFGAPYSNDMVPFYLVRDWAIVDPNPDQSMLTHNYLNEARQFISNAVAQNQPFFLYLPLNAPHVPVYVSPPFQGVTGRGLYADCVNEIDDLVGNILAHVAQLGIDGNTLVVLTSDNGPLYVPLPPLPGDPNVGGSAGILRGFKGSVYEGGIREPFVARWPGHIPAGTISNEPSVCFDLFTTIAGLAGAPLPADRVVDGRDLLPTLTGSGSTSGRDLFFCRAWNSGDPNWGMTRVWAMRRGPWKLHFDLNLNPTELYNLDSDVGESMPINNPALTATFLDKARQFECTLNDLPVATLPSADLALNRPVVVSSSRNCNTSAHACDGSLSTLWESDVGHDPWIQVDLGSVQPIADVGLWWGPAYGTHYQVEVSIDGTCWTPILDMDIGSGGREILRVSAFARYVKIQGILTLNGAGFSLRELAVRAYNMDTSGPHSAAHGPI